MSLIMSQISKIEHSLKTQKSKIEKNNLLYIVGYKMAKIYTF